jgi:hypothetical protein
VNAARELREWADIEAAQELSPEAWMAALLPHERETLRVWIDALRNPTIATDTRIRELMSRELLTFDAAAREALAG